MRWPAPSAFRNQSSENVAPTRTLSARMAILLVVLGGAVAVAPASLLGIPSNPDLSNHYHFALPFYDALRSGNFHPGWLASTNQGFGDPVFRFYPPGLYYLLALARMLTGNWYAGSLALFTLISIAGALGAYFWARSFLPRNIAVWAGVFYAFMPYHVAELYQAAQLAEYAAGAALLFAFGFVKRLCDEGRVRDMLGLAIAYACIILTHLPLAVIGSLSLLVYGLVCLRSDRLRATLLKLSLAAGMGLAASAFYWTTVVAEMRWIVGDGAHPDPMLDYRANFIFSTFSPEKNLSIWWMNILMLVTLAMFLPALVLFRKSSGQTVGRSERSGFVLMMFSVLMATALSKPIWVLVSPLQMTQHPFRWLSVTSAIVPILLAASIPCWRARFIGPGRPLALIATGLIAISLTFTVAQTIRDANYLPREKFEQMLEPVREASSINQWLPIWAASCTQGRASYEKVTPPKMAELAKAEGRSVKITSWEPERRGFSVGSGSRVDLRVHTLFYPHWTAMSESQTLATRPASDGTLLISLPENANSVLLRFEEPFRVHFSAAVSLGAWLLIAALFVFENRRARNHSKSE